MPPPFTRPRLRSDDAAIAYFRPYFVGRTREVLRVAHLDGDRYLIGASHYPGQHGSVDFPLRRIVADALAYGAEAMVIAHNHPSGDPAPSRADLAVTRRLADVARQLGIALIDHIIFAGDTWSSLRASGLL